MSNCPPLLPAKATFWPSGLKCGPNGCCTVSRSIMRPTPPWGTSMSSRARPPSWRGGEGAHVPAGGVAREGGAPFAVGREGEIGAAAPAIAEVLPGDVLVTRRPALGQVADRAPRV